MTLLNRRGDVMDFELISTEDLYEDDDVVVIRRTGKAFNAVVDNIDVAIKNEDGDITNIVELKSKNSKIYLILGCLDEKSIINILFLYHCFCQYLCY